MLNAPVIAWAFFFYTKKNDFWYYILNGFATSLKVCNFIFYNLKPLEFV